MIQMNPWKSVWNIVSINLKTFACTLLIFGYILYLISDLEIVSTLFYILVLWYDCIDLCGNLSLGFLQYFRIWRWITEWLNIPEVDWFTVFYDLFMNFPSLIHSIYFQSNGLQFTDKKHNSNKAQRQILYMFRYISASRQLQRVQENADGGATWRLHSCREHIQQYNSATTFTSMDIEIKSLVLNNTQQDIPFGLTDVLKRDE
jgi:hypothetical protein